MPPPSLQRWAVHAVTPMAGMELDLSRRLVPDELWNIVAPLLPSFKPRLQGGGAAPLDDRMVFTAVVYVLTSGCAWRSLPSDFGVSFATAHRRFTSWTQAGLWPRLRQRIENTCSYADAPWGRTIIEAANLRTKSRVGD